MVERLPGGCGYSLAGSGLHNSKTIVPRPREYLSRARVKLPLFLFAPALQLIMEHHAEHKTDHADN